MRKGDKVLLEAEYVEHVAAGLIKFRLVESLNTVCASHMDINAVTEEVFQVGDRFRVKLKDKWGDVLAVNKDGKRTWLWVKFDGEWPRHTLDANEVKRA